MPLIELLRLLNAVMRFDALGCCLLVLPLELSALSGCVLRSGYLELARSKITDFLALFN